MAGRVLTLKEVKDKVGVTLSSRTTFDYQFGQLTDNQSAQGLTKALTRAQLANLVLMSDLMPKDTMCVTETDLTDWAPQKISLTRNFETDDSNNFGDTAQTLNLTANGVSDYVVPGGYVLVVGYFRVNPATITYYNGWSYNFYLLTGTGFTYVSGISGGVNGGAWVGTPDYPLWTYREGEKVRVYVRYNNIGSEGSYADVQGWLVRVR